MIEVADAESPSQIVPVVMGSRGPIKSTTAAGAEKGKTALDVTGSLFPRSKMRAAGVDMATRASDVITYPTRERRSTGVAFVVVTMPALTARIS